MSETPAPVVGGVPGIPQLQVAVNALPGYQRAIEVAASADNWLNTQSPVPAVPAELEPMNTGQVSEEYIRAVQANSAALADFESKRHIVMRQKQMAANQANQIVMTGADLVLRALQEALVQLVNEATQLVGQLNGAATAEQAIAADAGPAWRQLTELADSYQDLRAGQAWVMMRTAPQQWRSCTPDLPGSDHANLAFLKGIDDLWPSWRRGGPAMNTVFVGPGNAPNVRHEPWPADEFSAVMLVWLVNNPDAGVWLPTRRQLRELWEERNQPEPAPEHRDEVDDPDRYNSLLIGPLEAERRRQAAGGKPPAPRRPDYSRVATPITPTRRPPQQLGAPA